MSNNKKQIGQAVSKNSLRDQYAGLFDDSDGDFFSVPAGLRKEIEEAGFECRLINAKKYQDTHGYHKSGWKVYKRADIGEAKSAYETTHGVDPEGFYRRGDLILAIKPVELQDKKRRKLALINAGNTDVAKLKAVEMRESIKSKGIDVTVDEGYDEK